MQRYDHLVLKVNRSPGNFTPWPRHPQGPWDPLEKERPEPLGHSLIGSQSVMVVQHHDGADHRAGHHDHNTREIGTD